MAVPGWPLPVFSTASIARSRTVSTAWSSSVDQVNAALPAEAARSGESVTSPSLASHGGPSQRTQAMTHVARDPDRVVAHVLLPCFVEGSPVTAVESAPAPMREHRAVSTRETIGAYVSLMKLRVVELLLITTVPAMVLAQRGMPPLGLTIVTLIGGTLAAGSAHAFNQVLARDIDAVMHRTRRRPVARAVVSPTAGFLFASVLLVLAVVLMLVWVNPLAALLTSLATLFYV